MRPISQTATLIAGLLLLGCGLQPQGQRADDGMGGDDSTGGDDGDVDDDGTDDGGDAPAPQDGDGHGGSGGDDDDGDDGDGEGGFCGTSDYAFTFEWQPPNVMLVLDQSGSMLTLWDNDVNAQSPAVTRWQSLHSVVSLVTSGFDDRMNFGVKLFPSPGAVETDPVLACHVDSGPDVPVAPNNAEAILDGIPAATSLDIEGGTPATAGIANAHAHLRTLDDETPRAMILVTDGAANCGAGVPEADLGSVYDENLELEVGQAFNTFGIPTYVVGINIVDALIDEPGNPIVNPFVALNDVADAGGVPRQGDERFYNAFNEPELEVALDEVAARIECTFVLEEEPTYPFDVRVELGGQTLSPLQSCDTGDGWTYTDGVDSAGAIELCGTACADLQQVHSLHVYYDCPE